jgi:polar amino acid transport system permease protein
MEAADAYGLSGWARFRRITWPTMLRLAWPAYTNEAIFLFHATTLVFFSGFPAGSSGGMRSTTPATSPTDLQPLRRLSDPGLLFHPADADDHRLMGRSTGGSTAILPQEARPRLRYRPQFIR